MMVGEVLLMRLGRRRGLWWKHRFVFRAKRRKNKKFNKILILALICLSFTYMTAFVNNRVKPIVIAMAEVRGKHIAIATMNKVIYERIDEYDVGYTDLVRLQTNAEGNITLMEANVVKINKLKSDIALRVQQEIENIDTSEISIPFGNIFSSDIFSGIGPYIPIRLLPVGNAHTDFKSSFEAAGINQTKHEISLIVESEVHVILPIFNTYSKVSTVVPIAQTIIVGKVPDQYVNIEGLGVLPYPNQ